MTQFHTVKEAARMTGKSSSSIRRIIYPIISAEQHPDREHIRPGVDEVRDLRLKGENFAWRLSDELLRRAVPEESHAEKGSDSGGSHRSHDGNGELLAMLRGELDIKNQQISQQSQMLSQQMELISGLSERLREGNILIGSLQQQLALPAASAKTKTNVVDAKAAKSAAGKPPMKTAAKPMPAAMQEKGSQPAVKPATPKTGSSQPASTQEKQQPKRGFFARWFR